MAVEEDSERRLKAEQESRQLEREKFEFEKKWFRSWAPWLLPLVISTLGILFAYFQSGRETRRADDAFTFEMIKLYVVLNDEEDQQKATRLANMIAARRALSPNLVGPWEETEAPAAASRAMNLAAESESDQARYALIADSAPILTTAAGQSAAVVSATPNSGCPAANPRLTVWLQYQRDEASARRVREFLNSCAGFNVPGIERVGVEIRSAQIRLYRSSDSARAQALSDALSADTGPLRGQQLRIDDLSTVYFSNREAPENILELWLP